jgi:hypothetical protein
MKCEVVHVTMGDEHNVGSSYWVNSIDRTAVATHLLLTREPVAKCVTTLHMSTDHAVMSQLEDVPPGRSDRG